jgi:hypothetical protein
MRIRLLLLFSTGLLMAASLAFLAPRCSAVPAWSRRYETPCSSCHAYPSLQLTGMGVSFLRRGHRLEDDAAEKDFSKLLSGHVEWAYTLEQHENAPFPPPEFHLHAGGALSPFVSAYLDANVNSNFEVVYGQYTHPMGKEGYWTARAGKTIPVILREYAAGLGAGGSTPLVIGAATLGQNPFTPTRDSYGLDAGGEWGRMFVQGGVVNGDDVPAVALVGSHKDLFATAQTHLSGQPTGAGVYYFRGGYDLVTGTSGESAFDRYDREAVFANVTTYRFRVAGAYLFGRDNIEGDPQQPTISGFYIQADLTPSRPLTPFARFDQVETEEVAGAGTVRQVTLGTSVALYVTDATGGRVSAEISRNDNGTSTTNAGTLTLVFAF